MSQLKKVAMILGANSDKTRKVTYPYYAVSKKYKKRMLRHISLLVHDEDGISSVGDRVMIQHCRPISKRKFWKIISVLEKNCDSRAE